MTKADGEKANLITGLPFFMLRTRNSGNYRVFQCSDERNMFIFESDSEEMEKWLKQMVKKKV